MKKRLCRGILLGCLLIVTTFLSTSCIYIGHHGMTARCEKEVRLSAPMPPGSSFAGRTSDGSITVEGLLTSECNVLAKVVTHAWTQEQADELAQQIDVRLEPTDDGLKVVIDKPPAIRNAGYDVSLDVNLPMETDLVLATSDGAVRVVNITGSVDARTSDGSIDAQGIDGDVKLNTSDGRVSCARVNANTIDLHTSDGNIKLADATAGLCVARTSDGGIVLTNVRGDQIELRTNDGSIQCRNINAPRLGCRTSDGAIHIDFVQDAPAAIHVNATTSDGSITLAAPPDVSAVIEAHTNDGAIRTHLPITIEGKIGKSLHGTIGAGEGKIYLKTSDGSITIR